MYSSTESNYQKYLAKLRFSCETGLLAIKAIMQVNQASTLEDIDVRIKATEQLISNLQDTRRHLFYFKNKLENDRARGLLQR